jgi:hypothetical protein
VDSSGSDSVCKLGLSYGLSYLLRTALLHLGSPAGWASVPVHTFTFPPPLAGGEGGGELGHMCGMEARVSPHLTSPPPLLPCVDTCVHFPSCLFLGEWRWVMVSCHCTADGSKGDSGRQLGSSMDCHSCGGCCPRGWGLSMPVAHGSYISPHPCQVRSLGHGSMRYPCLGWHPAADSELVWTKEHDKRGVGVTQESHKKLWVQVSHGRLGSQ